jgi:hypothetical protein
MTYHLLSDPNGLIAHIKRVLHEGNEAAPVIPGEISDLRAASSVLFSLGLHCPENGSKSEPCLVFNKRSAMVKQAGDLCFPGGSISLRLDSCFSKLLTLPFFPLGRWDHWSWWRRTRQQESRWLSLMLAASLRESLEEMRLNPLGVTFLGPLPPQQLWMFKRVIYPMVGWIGRQKHFLVNWEVEKIVRIPLGSLLCEDRYARYQLQMEMPGSAGSDRPTQDFPCFVHEHLNEREVLWGATYGMVTVFLEMVFGFKTPDITSLPVIHGLLDEQYLEGSA